MRYPQLFSLGLLCSIGLSLTSSVYTPSEATDPCSFRKSINLRRTDRYGIFGDDEFDTVVCGYLVTREEEIWDDTVNVAYLRIMKFGHDGFEQAIANGIKQGNSINVMRKGQYEFSLGCFEENQIKGTQYKQQTAYLTNTVQTKLQNSSKEQPIALILSFGKHIGHNCKCCNLAHSIRAY